MSNINYKENFKAIKKQLKELNYYDEISIDSTHKEIFFRREKGSINYSEFFKHLDYKPNNHIYINGIDFIIIFSAYNGKYNMVTIKEYSQFKKDGR